VARQIEGVRADPIANQLMDLKIINVVRGNSDDHSNDDLRRDFSCQASSYDFKPANSAAADLSGPILNLTSRLESVPHTYRHSRSAEALNHGHRDATSEVHAYTKVSGLRRDQFHTAKGSRRI
jgi:hypothetical protein